jgi:RNA polymerase-binding transcription factor DksA
MEGMMTDYTALAERLRARLAELAGRSDRIEDDLRGALDADYAEQASEIADDEALEEVDAVLQAEAGQIRAALMRIENGTYGTCGNCGETIAPARLEAEPAATRCIKCAA